MSEPNRIWALALDLKDDADLIAAYERWHQPGAVWPEVVDAIRRAGVRAMRIYRTGTRLFMILEAGADFSFERKAEIDAADPRVAAWEALMSSFQASIPGAPPGAKWVRMDQIFDLDAQTTAEAGAALS
jgi:L-rhamnose mutarotase